MPTPDPVARLIKTAPYLDYRPALVRGTGPHSYRRETGRGRRNNLDSVGLIHGWDFVPYAWAGEGRAKERTWLDKLFEEGSGELNEQPHRPHTCLSCSCIIEGDEPEIKIPGRAGPTSTRYSHASWQGCQAAMERSRIAFRASYPQQSKSRGTPGHGRATPVASSHPPRSRAGGILEQPPPVGEPMNTDILAIVRGFRHKGYTVEQSTGTSHFFVRNPDGSLYTTLPSTPHARGVTESQNQLRKAPDLKAADKAKRKVAAAAALGGPAPAEAPRPAEQMAELPEVREGKIPLTAWWLWDHLRVEAERGGRKAQYQGKDGWIWEGHVTAAMARLWPKLADADTVRREAVVSLGEYLRLTGHVVNIKNRGPNALSEYWLAPVWAGGPDTIGKARSAARGVKQRGGTHDQNIAAIEAAVVKLAAPQGTVTTGQLIAELPGINPSVISTLLGEVVASTFPLNRVKNGTYQYEGEPHMTQTPASRRPNPRLEVLRYKQERPDVPESVAEVAAALRISDQAAGKALREWWQDGTQGIDRLTGNLYVFRTHLLPDGHPLRNTPAETAPEAEMHLTPREVAQIETAAETPAPEKTALADKKVREAVEATKPKTPAGHQRIEDFVALRPDAKLYAEMFTTADGVTILIDEDGQMRELRPKK